MFLRKTRMFHRNNKTKQSNTNGNKHDRETQHAGGITPIIRLLDVLISHHCLTQYLCVSGCILLACFYLFLCYACCVVLLVPWSSLILAIDCGGRGVVLSDLSQLITTKTRSEIGANQPMSLLSA